MSARGLTTALALALAGSAACGPTTAQAPAEEPLHVGHGEVAPAPGGFEFPKKYKNWPVLSVTQRADKETLRIVTGNLTAVRAARSGETNPWPDGTIIASTLWRQAPGEDSQHAVSTGEFIRAEFMFKNVENYAANDSGWGWARWATSDLVPYGESEDVAQECLDCHKKVSGNDWVFMKPAPLP